MAQVSSLNPNVPNVWEAELHLCHAPKSISLQQESQRFCGQKLKLKQRIAILQTQAEYVDTYRALCFTVM